MRTFTLFSFLIGICCWPVFLPGQTLNVLPIANNKYNVSMEIPISIWPYANIPQSSTSPYFWVFLMDDNGGYFPPLLRTKQLANQQWVHKFCWENYLSSYRTNNLHFDYFYPAVTYRGDLLPSSLALFRKRDPDLPPDNELTVSSGPVHPASVSSTVRQATIPANKSIYLAHSHGYLKDYGANTNPHKPYNKSVFVIAYRPDQLGNTAPSNVHLFFGSKRTDTGVLPVKSGHFFPAPTAHIPKYRTGIPVVIFTPEVAVSNNSPFAYHSSFELPQNYAGAVQTAIGTSTEQRLFEIVAYDNNGTLTATDWSYALAVITTSQEARRRSNFTIAEMDTLVKNLDDVSFLADGSPLLGGQRILDIDTIYLKSGEPIDPNNMAISQVCENKYVTLKLKFCNLPPADMPATSSTFNFQVLDNNFEWCSLKSLEYPEGMPRTWTSCQPFCSGFPKSGETWYDCAEKSIKVHAPLDVNGCAVAEVVLSLKPGPNPASVNLGNYLYNHSLLKADVILHPNKDTLSVSDTLRSKLPRSLPGCEGTTSCERRCCTLWYYFFAFLALLAVGGGFWFWRSKKKTLLHPV